MTAKTSQQKLAEVYQTIYDRFKAGEYHWVRFNDKNRMSKIEDKDDPNDKLKKKMPEAKAHAAAVDFITFLFCSKSHLKYHFHYYKQLYIPWEAGKIKLQGIEFQEFVDFISPETKRAKK